MGTALLAPTSAMKPNHANLSTRPAMASAMVTESFVAQKRAFSCTAVEYLICMTVTDSV